MLGERPGGRARAARPGRIRRAGHPVYARLTVADHLRIGAWLNPGWDDELARRRIGQLGLDPKQRAGSLSGGQRAQLALTLALAKRPELLILDEPVAALDPLARREFLRTLMEAVAEHGISVVLSSHLIADLERVCDYLIVLVASQVRVAGEVSALLARTTGCPGRGATPPPSRRARTSSRRAIPTSRPLLIRTGEPILDPAWTVTPVTLDDLVLGYMNPANDIPARKPQLGVVS